MTRTIDRFWIARGLDAKDVAAMKGRSLAYAGLMAMTTLAAVLSIGIVQNLVA